jgi:hypothetical protein
MSDIISETKKCKTCHEEKKLSCFSKKRGVCKPCKSKRDGEILADKYGIIRNGLQGKATKVCKGCHEAKEIIDFEKDRRMCKLCVNKNDRKEYSEKRIVKIGERNKELQVVIDKRRKGLMDWLIEHDDVGDVMSWVDKVFIKKEDLAIMRTQQDLYGIQDLPWCGYVQLATVNDECYKLGYWSDIKFCSCYVQKDGKPVMKDGRKVEIPTEEAPFRFIIYIV